MALSGRVDKSTGVGSPGSNASLNNVVTTIQSSIPGPAGMPTDHIVITEQFANGVASTLTEVAGVEWYQRPLNTIVHQSSEGIVTPPDVNGTFTLVSGTYRVSAKSWIRAENEGIENNVRIALRIGDEGDIDVQKIFGQTIRMSSVGDLEFKQPEIVGRRFTINETKNVSLHIYTQDSTASINFGNPNSIPASGAGDSLTVAAGQVPEIYSVVVLEREGGDITEETQITVTDPLNPLATPKAKPLPPELLINPVTRRIESDRIVNEEFRPTENDWVGVNTRNSPEELGPKESKNAINVDSIGHPQQLRQRRGIAKVDIDTIVDVVGVSIYDTRLLRQSSTASLHDRSYVGFTWEDALLVQQFAELGVDVEAPPALEPDFVPAATIAPSITFINVQISAITRLSGIEAVRVAWNADAFPNDVFGSAVKKSDAFEEFFWFGDDAFNQTTTVSLASGDWYVTVWLKSHLGWSLPARKLITIP